MSLFDLLLDIGDEPGDINPDDLPLLETTPRRCSALTAEHRCDVSAELVHDGLAVVHDEGPAHVPEIEPGRSLDRDPDRAARS